MGKQFTVVGLGEVLWDLFPEGPQFGGAPANFACHAAMLGADALVVSQVGDDPRGRRSPRCADTASRPGT
jgi:fructokinase